MSVSVVCFTFVCVVFWGGDMCVSFFGGGACVGGVCTGKSKAHESSGVCEQVSFHDLRGYVLCSSLEWIFALSVCQCVYDMRFTQMKRRGRGQFLIKLSLSHTHNR
jgi:hypothetical protein